MLRYGTLLDGVVCAVLCCVCDVKCVLFCCVVWCDVM